MGKEITSQPPLYEHSMIFKSCVRCQGDRQVRRDVDGFYIACLSCGHVTYPEVQTSEETRLLEWKHAS